MSLFVVDSLCGVMLDERDGRGDVIVVGPQIVAIARDTSSGSWLFKVRETRGSYTYATTIDYYIAESAQSVGEARVDEGMLTNGRVRIEYASVKWYNVADPDLSVRVSLVRRAVRAARRQ